MSTLMPQAPHAPLVPQDERPPVVQSAPTAAPMTPPYAPPAPTWPVTPPAPIPPYAMPTPGAPMPVGQLYAPARPPMPSVVPTAGQRLGLAITSLALFIPLLALLLNFATPAVMPVGLSITVGLLGTLVLGLVVVGVNMVFNWDLLRPRR